MIHFNINKKLLTAFLVAINVGILLGVSFLVYKSVSTPTSNQEANQDQKIIDKIAKLTTVDKTKNPSLSTIADIDKLKEGNAVQAEVYKDAKNGDFVLSLGDEIIVYRESEDKVIYEGDSISKILTDTENKIINKVSILALSPGLRVGINLLKPYSFPLKNV